VERDAEEVVDEIEQAKEESDGGEEE
jgi:hypothetical protein